MKVTLKYLLAISLFLCFTACVSPSGNEINSPNKTENIVAKNVIFMIGDGMSYAQIQAAETALNKRLVMSSMPVTGNITTHSADKLITDSGAGGTALATGHKTNNGMIGMLADSTAVESLLEVFADAGKKTGIVVSCGITHATPASFVAKDISRNNYDAIAADIADSEKLHYFIAGGRNHFQKRVDSANLLIEMQEKGWQFYDNIEAVDLQNDRFGVFVANDHPGSAVDGRGDMLPKGAKLLMEKMSTNPQGFFLMIEGSQIDWAGHDNDSAYLVEEMKDFDAAVAEVLSFAKNDGETLVIITADHETGGLTLVRGANKDYGKVRFNFSTGSHTSVTVPVYSFGPGAELFSGAFDNTDIFGKALQAAGL